MDTYGPFDFPLLAPMIDRLTGVNGRGVAAAEFALTGLRATRGGRLVIGWLLRVP